MERLTQKSINYCAEICRAQDCETYHGVRNDVCGDAAIYNRLAAYEDLEEQGRLVVLPCKVGDTVYHPLLGEGEVKTIYIRSMALILVVFDDESHLFPFSEFGESVFTSRAEAEAALKGAKDAR